MVAFGLILLLIGVGAGGWLAWLALQSETGVTLGATGLQLTVLPITLFVAGAASMPVSYTHLPLPTSDLV